MQRTLQSFGILLCVLSLCAFALPSSAYSIHTAPGAKTVLNMTVSNNTEASIDGPISVKCGQDEAQYEQYIGSGDPPSGYFKVTDGSGPSRQVKFNRSALRAGRSQNKVDLAGCRCAVN